MKGKAMDKRETGIVDLGDARTETRGLGVEGPIDLATLQRTYNDGIQADD
jgi:hypothetical protein